MNRRRPPQCGSVRSRTTYIFGKIGFLTGVARRRVCRSVSPETCRCHVVSKSDFLVTKSIRCAYALYISFVFLSGRSVGIVR
jgi:hypothetical protein